MCREEKERQLLNNMKACHTELAKLLDEVNDNQYEDSVYRYYHRSFKVYGLQNVTRRIVEALRRIAPEKTDLAPYFEEIYQAGASGKRFEKEHNKAWTSHTRPFVEVFFHARYFLEMAVKYGRELDTPPTLLPSGWAAFLELYKIRC